VIRRVRETVGALYKRAWDEQVAPRYRSGEPAPGMSRNLSRRRGLSRISVDDRCGCAYLITARQIDRLDKWAMFEIGEDYTVTMIVGDPSG
jgi:hypothetical protein